MTMQYKKLAALNTIGFIAVIIVNSLANGLPINGFTTGELSAFYPNLFVPAGITFSIWGVIYSSLLFFIIYQWSVSDHHKQKTIESIGYWFLISCIANCSWIIAWHYMITPLSVLVMLVLLMSLITIYKRLHQPRNQDIKVPLVTKFFVFVPFSLYLGWISVATIANITAMFVDFGWDGTPFSETTWTSLMIITALMLALRFLLLQRDLFFAIPIGWALIGILIKRMNDEDPFFSIIMSVNAGILLITFGLILQLVRRKFY